MAIAVLTLAAALGGPAITRRPGRAPDSFWQVTGVPVVLGAVLAVGGVVLVAIAAGLLGWIGGRRGRGLAWMVLLVVSAAALGWNALYLASLSTFPSGPVIPVFDWLYTLVPALISWWIFGRGETPGWSAALASGVVTLPLVALGWALSDDPGLSWGTVLGAVQPTAVFGTVPLAVTVVVAARSTTTRSPHAERSRPHR